MEPDSPHRADSRTVHHAGQALAQRRHPGPAGGRLRRLGHDRVAIPARGGRPARRRTRRTWPRRPAGPRGPRRTCDRHPQDLESPGQAALQPAQRHRNRPGEPRPPTRGRRPLPTMKMAHGLDQQQSDRYGHDRRIAEKARDRARCPSLSGGAIPRLPSVVVAGGNANVNHAAAPPLSIWDMSLGRARHHGQGGTGAPTRPRVLTGCRAATGSPGRRRTRPASVVRQSAPGSTLQLEFRLNLRAAPDRSVDRWHCSRGGHASAHSRDRV
jgi:hypothetical protein